jgi:hypothetical protein
MSYSVGDYVRCGLLIAVLICVPTAMANAGDAWSPGATAGEAWQRIQRLQSVSQAARVRSPFVTQCLESKDAVERAAAVCWVARTRSAVHAVDLEKRLLRASAAEDLLGGTVEWAKRHLPEHFEYTVVKLNQRNDSVSFIYCPNFDAEHEPAITAIMVVSADGTVQRRTTPNDPYIYHHKWLFVGG